ncbi:MULTISPECIES: rhamnulokinase [Mediterraneibacter]|jgi:rhamnulokinase|uniref:rhamnulokinase n=1 Tax=Mediterraneibacter TaxID=2316020 RepID=UPI000E4B7E04|nr:rhamnulokinase family protein [Mediterraneibacter massiliensis]RGT74141.1 rhamnulokinase [Ruminococcus sp. AF18-22]
MKYLGFDLGASSGKMMLGELDGARLKAEVIHRFPNRQILAAGGLYWDILNIYSNLKNGIEKAVYESGAEKLTLGLDSFCNDFGLVDREGRLVNQVYCYRDERTRRKAQEIYAKVSQKELYMETGSQTALFNTVIQMAAMVEEGEGYLLEKCRHALMLPDLLAYFLTGRMQTEYTLASVTQMLDWRTNSWHSGIMRRLGIREDIFPKIVPTGTSSGVLEGTRVPELAGACVQVVSVCGHDTASAIAALPTTKEHVAYISSGTWSIVGTEVEKPILTEEAFRLNIAYEGGIDYRYRMIKNVMGLWILQECQSDYARRTREECSHAYTAYEAEKAPARRYMIEPDDASFYMPGNMLEKVAQYCEKTGQGRPETFGEIVRAVMESLAMKYRYMLEKMEEILGYRLEEIYILGGGGQNRLLDQLTADVCGRVVYAGPYEAGLVGNLMVQMRSVGEIQSLKEGRQMIRDSFEIAEFVPQKHELWEESYSQFKRLLEM